MPQTLLLSTTDSNGRHKFQPQGGGGGEEYTILSTSAGQSYFWKKRLLVNVSNGEIFFFRYSYRYVTEENNFSRYSYRYVTDFPVTVTVT
jgi:hypothetical protein